MKIGIEGLAFSTSRYALELSALAEARGIDPRKYAVGLGIQRMSVAPPDEDIVTLAATAAQKALEGIDRDQVEMLLFATESGIDQSKAAGIYVHGLLDLPRRCRVVELKQACYSGAFALQLALPFLHRYPDKKVLVVASDIARYGLATPGEPSQGCGAVAMVLSAQPRLLAFDAEYGVATDNVMDFWRPNYSDFAFVEGKYSSRLYLQMLEEVWGQFTERSGFSFDDIDHFCYHTPVPKLVEKAHQSLASLAGHKRLEAETLARQVGISLDYGRQLGNSYTATLFIGLSALLERSAEDLSGRRVGFYSYGSGCIAEYFSGQVLPGYRDHLHSDHHRDQIEGREILDVEAYERFYSAPRGDASGELTTSRNLTSGFRFAGIEQHRRIYERLD
ncbi:hydroxymethylglutaryl-CoA synthase [Halotalea alkalilenta]|uniref:Hydroxymethylglutaryl-CoA synthase n=1 Tax=Halotalea alkalilenta TaxID=376489 RepID=A0A172YIT0_9GAMM|nr:hydroxymethylglutaryl-CoA synthase [Halotalea alkalilenta]ANF59096.1 hydroxymethylglutaryl-CoA synthase [Halotalea alkalilenta]